MFSAASAFSRFSFASFLALDVCSLASFRASSRTFWACHFATFSVS